MNISTRIEIDPIPSDQFWQMITDEKAERKDASKCKWQNDLRRIQEMKSKAGLEPLEQFPKEIWLTILSELFPEDKRSMGQVHKLFSDLLGKSYVGDVLLPRIIEFKVKRRWLWRDDDLQIWTAYTRKPIALYAELRLVSRTMRNAIDRWFENDLLAKLYCKQFSNYSSPTAKTTFELVEKSSDHRLGKIFEDPNTDTTFRFFTRSLRFTYPRTTESWDPFNEIASYALLDRIGDQIWYFSFEVPGTRTSQWSEMYLNIFYRLLMKWLAKMPNLKWLSLRLALDKEKQVFDLQSELQPPSLPHLKRLDLNCNLPQFAKAILSVNVNVKVLSFLGTDLLDYMNISGIQALLHVEGFILEKWGGWMNPLQSVTSKIWQLKWAHISLGLREPVFSTYHYLSNFKTLERLSLRFFNTILGDDIAYLELPKLLEFDVLFNKAQLVVSDEKANFFMTFQYLMYARKLTKFSWSCSMVNSQILQECVLGDRKITFGGCWPDLRKSNIFQVFPLLQSVLMALYNPKDKCWIVKKTFHRK